MACPCVQEMRSQKAIYKQDTISLIVRPLLPCGVSSCDCLGEHAIHGLDQFKCSLLFLGLVSKRLSKQFLVY